MNSRNAFAAELWSLHRNSLLFSALLFVLCSPGIQVDSKQSVFWISITGATLSELQFVSFLAATYAFLAFFLEWLYDVYPYYREQIGVTKTVSEKIAQVSDSLKSYEGDILAQFGTVQSEVQTLLQDRTAMGDKVLSNIAAARAEVNTGHYVAQRLTRLLPERHHPNFLHFDHDLHEKYAEAARAATADAADEAINQVQMAFASPFNQSLTSIENNLAHSRKAMNDLQLAIKQGRSGILRQLKASFILSKLSLAMRVWVVSFAIPTMAYAAAVVRFLVKYV